MSNLILQYQSQKIQNHMNQETNNNGQDSEDKNQQSVPINPKDSPAGGNGTPQPPAIETRFLPVLELPDAEPWPEPVDGKALLDELVHTLKLLVILPKCAAEI